MTDTTIDRVRKIVIEHLDCDPNLATDKASFIDELGADSLDAVELIMGFEEEFDVEIRDDEAGDLDSISKVAEFIDKKLSAK